MNEVKTQKQRIFRQNIFGICYSIYMKLGAKWYKICKIIQLYNFVFFYSIRPHPRKSWKYEEKKNNDLNLLLMVYLQRISFKIVCPYQIFDISKKKITNPVINQAKTQKPRIYSFLPDKCFKPLIHSSQESNYMSIPDLCHAKIHIKQKIVYSWHAYINHDQCVFLKQVTLTWQNR